MKKMIRVEYKPPTTISEWLELLGTLSSSHEESTAFRVEAANSSDPYVRPRTWLVLEYEDQSTQS